jgi:hypothetical protein
VRRDKASQHLTKLIQAARRLNPQDSWAENGGTPLNLLGDLDFYLLRRSSETDVDRNPSLKAAFDTFRLDPTSPNHWRRLLALFAGIHFDSGRGRGNPKQWDEMRLCQLLADFAAVKLKHPKKKDKELRGEIKKDVRFKKRYGKLSAETIRKKLQHARDPKHNDFLRDILLAYKPDLRGMSFEQWHELALENIAKRLNNPQR